jgi:hypothetical protein
MARYYRINSRAITFREYWRIARGKSTFLVFACAKLFGIRIGIRQVYALEETVRLVEPGQVPDHVQEAWTTQVELCREQGFRLVCHYHTDVVPNAQGFMAAFVGDGKRILAQALYVGTRGNAVTGFGCRSRLAEGRILSTSNIRVKWNPPSWTVSESEPGRPAAAVLARHRERMHAPGLSLLPYDEKTLPTLLQQDMDRLNQYYFNRGLFIPVPTEEAERILAGQR